MRRAGRLAIAPHGVDLGAQDGKLGLGVIDDQHVNLDHLIRPRTHRSQRDAKIDEALLDLAFEIVGNQDAVGFCPNLARDEYQPVSRGHGDDLCKVIGIVRQVRRIDEFDTIIGHGWPPYSEVFGPYAALPIQTI